MGIVITLLLIFVAVVLFAYYLKIQSENKALINRKVESQIETLDKKPEFIEPPQDRPTANQNQEDSPHESTCYTFFVDSPRIQDITYVGMPVNLWIPHEKNPDKVFIYHRNGPYGPLGFVPSKYSDIVVSHLEDALDYEAKIVELTDNTCKIVCILYSKEGTKRRNEEYKVSLKKELIKSYKPKTPIKLMIAAKKKGVKVGDKLKIEFKDLDSYIQDVTTKSSLCPWQIRFLDQAGQPIGILDNDKSRIQRILKAHFNSYLLDIEVLDVHQERSTAWKGYPLQLVITPYIK
jgi:hypothetical protein